tara:strand:+ start:287 stop:934 length:648 start_codon:yes stop_codon:yes gene_type:complete
MSQIKAEYINHMGSDIDVVNAARVSYDKVIDKIKQKDEKLLNYLAKHKHFTPFEHTSLSVRITCPLYIRSQIMRHRTFSYNEVSRRYTSENIDFYVPDQYRKQHDKSKQCSDGNIDFGVSETLKVLTRVHHKECLSLYEELINDHNVSREQARGLLPQNLITKFVMTGNLRNWIHFLNLRLDSHAQEEVRVIAEQIKEIIEDKFNLAAKALFDNI